MIWATVAPCWPAPRREHQLRHAPWRKAFVAELLTFPAGKHDDQVDALGLVGQLLDKMIKGTARKPEAKEPKDSWAKLFDRPGPRRRGLAHRLTAGVFTTDQRPLIDGEQPHGRQMAAALPLYGERDVGKAEPDFRSTPNSAVCLAGSLPGSARAWLAVRPQQAVRCAPRALEWPCSNPVRARPSK